MAPAAEKTVFLVRGEKQPSHPLVLAMSHAILRMTTAINRVFTALNGFYTKLSNAFVLMRMAEAFSAMTQPFFSFAAAGRTETAQITANLWTNNPVPALQWQEKPLLPPPADKGTILPFWPPEKFLFPIDQRLGLSFAVLYLAAVTDLMPRLAQSLILS